MGRKTDILFHHVDPITYTKLQHSACISPTFPNIYNSLAKHYTERKQEHIVEKGIRAHFPSENGP